MTEMLTRSIANPYKYGKTILVGISAMAQGKNNQASINYMEDDISQLHLGIRNK